MCPQILRYCGCGAWLGYSSILEDSLRCTQRRRSTGDEVESGEWGGILVIISGRSRGARRGECQADDMLPRSVNEGRRFASIWSE